MQLDLLTISNLRNLSSIDLNLNARFNIFWGKNGSGKTSLLEALHVLATGRSFRTSRASQIITFEKDSFMISGIASPKNALSVSSSTISSNTSNGFTHHPVRLGIERFRTGSPKIRLAEKDCESIAELARILPIQLINSESYTLLEGHSQYRRQFLDWSMFHVEQTFYSIWQRFKRALQQRNAALKLNVSVDSIRAWNKELVETGEVIDILRKNILGQLAPLFSEIIETFWGIKDEVTLQYRRGWSEDFGLQHALDHNFERDRVYGYTTLGPQRADLEWFIGGVAARTVLSRGQLKLFICALLIARAQFLYEKTGRRCIFLVDDLNSELDTVASSLLVESLYALGGQVLVTCIEGDVLDNRLQDREYTMFHVEQGLVSAGVEMRPSF